MADLRVVAGLDADAREAKKAARKRCGDWRRALKVHLSEGRMPRLLRGDLLLAEELTNFPSADFGYCYAGQAKLAGRLGASRRTAQRAMARLVAAGFLACARGGQGRTSRWSFAVDGKPLFGRQNDASRCDTDDASRSAKMTLPDATRMAPLDATRMAHKPYRTEPVELSPCEQEPLSTPTPPPRTEPRAREARSIADEVLKGLTPAQRQSNRWRGLSRWIAGLLDQGHDPADVSVGLLQAMDSLSGATPSSFSYFMPPIERARAARLKPLPAASHQGHVSAARLAAYVAERLDVEPAELGGEWIAEQHRLFIAQAVGMPEIIAGARARLRDSFTQNTPKPLGAP